MIIRPATLISFALAALLSFSLYKVKYAVMGQERQLVAIEDQIVGDENALHVLNAQWSQETQPDQLGAMAERHLALAPILPAQLQTFAQLPMRVAPAPVSPPAAASVAAPQAVAAIHVVHAPTLVASVGDMDAMLRAIQTETDPPDPHGGGTR